MEAKQRFKKILETYGGETADKSINRLLEDPQLTSMTPFTEFIAKNWRDSFTPTMMNLGCRYVGGNPKDTEEIAVGVSLINLAFRLWDDIIDETSYRTLKPTFMGKFGKNNALIYGGTLSAKAFTTINKAPLEPEIKEKINGLIWNYWATLAKTETEDLSARATQYTAASKFNKIETEAINVQTSLKIGAIIGKGSVEDIKLLETYGKYLGIMLELLKDVQVSLNLTLEIEKKIQQNQLPLLLLLGREESGEIREEIECLNKKRMISPEDMGHLIDVLLNSRSWEQLTSYFEEANEKCRIAISAKNKSHMLLMIAKNQYETFLEIKK